MRPASRQPDGTGKRKALCVDDNPDVVDAVKETLEGALPLLVDTAQSGEDAIELLRENEYDVIVSDNQMPGMDGLTFLRTARDMAPTTARILISAGADPDLIAGALQNGGITAFFPKPINARLLVEAVGRALDERDAGIVPGREQGRS